MAKRKAFGRQATDILQGVPCAICGAFLDVSNSGEGIVWFAIPRIPIKNGGKGGDNCVIVCAKCNRDIGQDGTRVIPYSQLPYFKGNLKQWLNIVCWDLATRIS